MATITSTLMSSGSKKKKPRWGLELGVDVRNIRAQRTGFENSNGGDDDDDYDDDDYDYDDNLQFLQFRPRAM